MSMALAYLLKKPLTIKKIRANRGKGGGLGNQHLTGVGCADLATIADASDRVVGGGREERLHYSEHSACDGPDQFIEDDCRLQDGGQCASCAAVITPSSTDGGPLD